LETFFPEYKGGRSGQRGKALFSYHLIMIRQYPHKKSSTGIRVFLSILFVIVISSGFIAYKWFSRSRGSLGRVMAWIQDPGSYPEWTVTGRTRCNDAPFVLPSSGFIGFLWDDSFRPGHRHQGIDIFGDLGKGKTPVFAAFSGYLTRLPGWKSSVIIRVPSDPLKPGRQIWTYYTHMADSEGESYILNDFPMGTNELYVEQGTLLGYQGNYSGDPNNPTGVHLHFSIVKDDGQGGFMNELKIQNTFDPSPYLGLELNAKSNANSIPLCEQLDESLRK
jgi:murein DD-endopeptidase MepM/ murein hydrolase activator NlpD